MSTRERDAEIAAVAPREYLMVSRACEGLSDCLHTCDLSARSHRTRIARQARADTVGRGI